MSLLEQTKNLCQQYHIVPTRSKGQNFLISEEAYEAMIEVAELRSTDIILEVGPGLGFLTEYLASRAQKVFSVELDDVLAKVVQKRLQEKKITNVVIYNENILNFTGQWAQSVKTTQIKVVANLPYNISSYFLRKFIAGNEGNILPDRLILMLQKEVGERLVAVPGDMSVLAVSVQLYAQITLIKNIPAHSFWPAPKVGSVIISITRDSHYQKQLTSLGIKEKIFFRVVKIGFSSRRKMLKANLAAGLQLKKEIIIIAFNRAKIKENARAQELSLENWCKLIAALKEYMV